jgi:hypothetical protein
VQFFYEEAEFEEETAFYSHPVLRTILPAILFATNNANAGLVSPRGFVFPPFLVLERGITLTAWGTQEKRGFFEITTMIERVAELLKALHDANFVHRDLSTPLPQHHMLRQVCLVFIGVQSPTAYALHCFSSEDCHTAMLH